MCEFLSAVKHPFLHRECVTLNDVKILIVAKHVFLVYNSVVKLLVSIKYDVNHRGTF